MKEENEKELRIVRCGTEAEWSAAKHFRNKYFFDPLGISDPYTWTFDLQDHIHLVLYQNEEIVGYAHIQLWPQNRAALRIIVIDEEKRKKNLGSQFLTLCEGWLKHIGVKVFHAESRATSLNFYTKNGYVPMPFDDPDHHESDPQDIAIGKAL